MTRVVIVHPERGIFIGEFLGMGFWTKWEVAEQSCVVTFEDEADARDYVSGWTGDHEAIAAFTYHPVAPDMPRNGASAAALRAAGLEDHLGLLAHPAWAEKVMGHA